MSDRVYRIYSPSRRESGRICASKGHAQGMAGAANQGAVAFGIVPDWVVQSALVSDWEDS